MSVMTSRTFLPLSVALIAAFFSHDGPTRVARQPASPPAAFMRCTLPALPGVPSGEFSALTYNVAGLPEGVSKSQPARFMPLIAPRLNRYDLVLVQESWLTPDPNPYWPLRVYHEILAAWTDHAYKSEPAPLPLGRDPDRPQALVSDGLNQFSRLPFDRVVRRKWEDCFDSRADCFAEKGFSVARTTLAPGVEVDVYNVHMEAGSKPEDDRVRDRNIAQLADFMEGHSAGRAVIAGGDFNLRTSKQPGARQQLARLLARTGLTDVCAALDCPIPAHIDKFFFRASEKLTIVPTSWRLESDVFRTRQGEALSDHTPLAVHFAWSAGPPAGLEACRIAPAAPAG
jgi:hypothetical protein